MRYCLFMAIAIFSFSSGFAQTQLKISQNFEVGKTYKFEIKRGKEDSRDPNSQRIYTITLANASVTNGDDNKRIVTFVYGESTIEGADIPQNLKEQLKSQELYYGIEISVTVDNEGNFFQLSNYESAKKQLENAMIKMYKSSGASIDETTFSKVRQQLAVTYDSKEKLLGTYFPELSSYFSAFGKFYQKGEPQEQNYKSVNPFSGESFPITSKEVYDKLEGNTAIINVTETIQPEDLSRIMKSTFKNIAESAGRPFNEKEIPEFDLITTSEMRYNIVEKMLISVAVNKQIIAGRVKQNAITEIRMVN